MGYEQKELKVIASVSRHNSVEDKIHDLLWQNFMDRVDRLMSEDRYKPISLMSI